MEECEPCPVFASFTLAFALQLRKKHGKTSVRLRKTSVRLRKTSVRLRKISVRLHLSQSTVYILPKHPHVTKPTHTYTYTHTHTHTHTHRLQNNIKPPQYKLTPNAHRKSNTMGRKNSK